MRAAGEGGARVSEKYFFGGWGGDREVSGLGGGLE